LRAVDAFDEVLCAFALDAADRAFELVVLRPCRLAVLRAFSNCVAVGITSTSPISASVELFAASIALVAIL
jgi:hypothetical protein